MFPVVLPDFEGRVVNPVLSRATTGRKFREGASSDGLACGLPIIAPYELFGRRGKER